MPKKLLLFGGLSVASVATLTPGGIFLQKVIKTKQIEKERTIFVSKAKEVAGRLNERESNKNSEISFPTDSSDSDIWKLMWIWDVFKYHQEYKKPLQYTKEAMNQAQQFYWNEQVSKQQGKWKDKAIEKRLQKANVKNQYWEKFKEICLILIADEQIKEENMNYSTGKDTLLCNHYSAHNTLLSTYKNYKEGSSSPIGIMEHFWTVEAKQSGS